MKVDIENKIKENFTDTEKVINIISQLTVPDIEKDRVIRCVLFLSDSDIDSLKSWVKKANIDRRDIYFFAEYDNHSERKWNFGIEYDKQKPYQFRDSK